MKALLTDSHSVFALLVVLLATALLIAGKLSGAQWWACVQWTLTAFVGTHVALHATTTLAGSSASSPPA